METAEITAVAQDITKIFEAQKKRSLTLRTSTIAERKTKLKKLKSWVLSHQEDIHKGLIKRGLRYVNT